MLNKTTSFVLFLLISLTKAEDSLQSALNAVNRKQRDLSSSHHLNKRNGDGPYYAYTGDNNNEDNLGFLLPDHDHNVDLENALYDYLEEQGLLDGNTPAAYSSFRERMEPDLSGSKVRSDMRFNDQDDDSDEYDQLIQRVYGMNKDYPDNFDDIKNYKRLYYNNLGWDSVGMKKKSRYFQPDVPNDPSTYLLNYSLRDEMYNRLGGDNANSDWNLVNREEKSHPYMKKRFPVSKRVYYPSLYQSDITHQHKRSTFKETPKTDPKTEKDLSMIFNPNHKASHKVPTEKPKKPTDAKKTKPKEIRKSLEEFQPVQVNGPIEIKKKSVNWSDYFGLDRRKKSQGIDVDNDWSLSRYHQAIDAPKKRSGNEYPLKIFHKNEVKKETESKDSEEKIKDLDGKLKNIEDSMVDEALKITGANEGSVDSKQVQEAKDKIINRLAAAFRLEKMRRALNEYRMSLKKGNKLNEDDETIEKRVAVPRKQAVEKITEDDNTIKCTENDENCDETNYKTTGGSELLERANWDKNKCPKIERACNEISVAAEPYEKQFEMACFYYQMCLICGGNSWFSPIRQCNIMFLSKADHVCDGDEDCRKVARQSIKYLLHANRSIRNDPNNGCEIGCPDKR